MGRRAALHTGIKSLSSQEIKTPDYLILQPIGHLTFFIELFKYIMTLFLHFSTFYCQLRHCFIASQGSSQLHQRSYTGRSVVCHHTLSRAHVTLGLGACDGLILARSCRRGHAQLTSCFCSSSKTIFVESGWLGFCYN